MKKTASIGIIVSLILSALIGILSLTGNTKASNFPLPFEDDFEDGDITNWNDASDMYGSIRIESGNLDGTGSHYLYLDSPPEPANQARAILENGGNQSWNNYELEFDTKIDYTSGSYAYVNVFFYLQSTTNVDNGYFLQMKASQNDVQLSSKGGGSLNELKNFAVSIDTVYHFDIITNNGNIKVHINDELVFDVNDNTYSYGTIGFGTHGAGAETVKTSFDNVNIKSYSGQGQPISYTVTIGPFFDKSGDRIPGITVSFAYDGKQYNAMTGTDGKATFYEVPFKTVPNGTLITVILKNIEKTWIWPNIEYDCFENVITYPLVIGVWTDENGNNIVGITVSFTYEGKQYSAVTGKDGNAIFNLPMESIPNGTIITAKYNVETVTWKLGDEFPEAAFVVKEKSVETKTPGFEILFLLCVVFLVVLIWGKLERGKLERL